MKLQICTREEAENLAGRPNWAVISITDQMSAFGPAKLSAGWRAIHRVEFHDADPRTEDPEQHIMMTLEDARGIVKFVRLQALNVQGFMIHCNQGIGRSQGVAAWLAEICYVPQIALTSPDAEFALDPRFNKHVLETLRMADR
jgi:predicted protein tyrosine phosphatase